MRRLGALAITVGLAWFAVARAGHGEHTGSAALALGVVLIAASIVGWLFQFLRLPRITGYLVFGLICGPSVANIITRPMARGLQAADGLAVVIIAFIAGLQLSQARLLPRARMIGVITAVTIAVIWTGTATALAIAWRWLPIAPAMAGAERWTVISIAATLLVGASPALTTAVIAEGRARGALADFTLGASVTAEAVVLLFFAIVLSVAHAVFGEPLANGAAPLATLFSTVVGSIALGASAGALFAIYVRVFGREVTLVFLGLCGVLLGVGATLHVHTWLTGLAAGIIVERLLTNAGEILRDGIERGAVPIFVLFFTTMGASLRLDALADVGIVALLVAVVRVGLLVLGTRAGQRMAGTADPEARYLWFGLVATAGATLSLAAVVASEYPDWGAPLATLVAAVAAILDLAGPIVFRAALADRHEIGRRAAGLVVVSNREPWVHEFTEDGSIRARSAPGGVAVALDALMRERGGVWIAHGGGSADRDVVDEHDSIDVPPDAPAYRLHRLWLSKLEEERYYAGFANGALWPLCHQAHVRPVFNAEDWEAYQTVNRRFAAIAAIDAPPDAAVFLNDYHLALVAPALRHRRPTLPTALFWHIPWPDVDRLRICPWRRELVQGLLGNDLLAFQLPRDRRHFLEAAEDAGGSVSGDTVHFRDHAVRVVAVPIGADFDRIGDILASPQLASDMERIQRDLSLAGKVVGIGVDRLDYTKGIPERIAALERTLEMRPDLARDLVFVQIGVPSRSDVHGYAAIAAEIDSHVARVNEKFGSNARTGPIRHVTSALPLPQVVALYRLADFCVVSSLHDGMNLVAKEFVAARDDLDGVLVLSELAGAAQELSEALIINPYDERAFAAAILRAIQMPTWERRRRMQMLRRRVAGRDVLAWASDILDHLEKRNGSGFRHG